MPNPSDRIVVVGSGHAAYQLASSLAHAGHRGSVTLIGDEPGLPYSRPPLSKEYLAGTVSANALNLCDSGFFDGDYIRLVHARATGIDRVARQVLLGDGREVEYDRLVLATGAHLRRVPSINLDLGGVTGLRTREDADEIRERLAEADHVAVIGAGFIGMEFAAHVIARGRSVTVFDVAARALARSVTEPAAAILVKALREAGVDFRFDQGAAGLEDAAGNVKAVLTTSGERIPAQLVVVAPGVVPNAHLASECGLLVNDGVVTDPWLKTSDPRIYAVGDCARFPHTESGRLLRLESVQNANEQAKCVAHGLMGDTAPYDAVPWFWTQQGPNKLQIAGVRPADGTAQVRVHAGVDARGRHAFFVFVADNLVCVETFNAPAQHLAARALLASEKRPSLQEVQHEDFDLVTAHHSPPHLHHADVTNTQGAGEP